ncbi:MAG: hypothetical protein J6A69_08260 [Clostridia bacterium]|nr:hypothetical protein [Clostridia bacterium]
MKKRFQALILCVLLFTGLTGCSNSKEGTTQGNAENDLYVGEYISTDEIDGELKIEKSGNTYKIHINFYDLTQITATGKIQNGTLNYEGTDKYGNKITGNIEEYGEDYPVRVEFYGDGLSDEIEFERK